MSEIKTWQERCLERGIGSCEARDEELIELRAALAERDALQVRVTALESIANSDDGAGGEGMKLYIENRDMKSRLAALEVNQK